MKVFTSVESGHTREVVASAKEGGASLNILSGFVAGNFSAYWLGLSIVSLMGIGYLVSNTFGLGDGMLAPAATPRPVIARLQTATAAALRTPELNERLLREGSEPVGGPPEQFAAMVKTDIAKWAVVVKQSGMKAE